MIKIYTPILLITLFISGCFYPDLENNNSLTKDNLTFNYYSDKSVSSLEVPPDLTSPDYQNAFRLNKLAPNAKENFISKSGENDTTEILKSSSDIQIIKDGARRWLEIGKDSETIWQLSLDFLKNMGFNIEISNKKTGIIQTNFLENRPKPNLPKSSLNIIKQMLQDVGKTYSLASLDRYRIRVEPNIDNTKTEVFLTLDQMQEVVSDTSNEIEQTVYQAVPKNDSIEVEMLYNLMIFLGGDAADSREKIINSSVKEITPIFTIKDSINGYAKLVVDMSVVEAWDNISWALDQIRVDIEDKDFLEKTFYINDVRTSDRGISSIIFGEDAVKKSFQIVVKQVSENKSEVYFNDVSELNETETKEYSYDFFKKLLKHLK